jgi:hypothetical protein
MIKSSLVQFLFSLSIKEMTLIGGLSASEVAYGLNA